MLPAAKHVLDVGCGTGALTRECLRRGSRATGIDINPAMLTVAEREAPGATFRVGDACDLPFPDSVFDHVVSQAALMFVPNAERALAEMARVLRPGGSLALLTWASLIDNAAYDVLAGYVRDMKGAAAADLFSSPFRLGEKESLADLFAHAGLLGASVERVEGTARFDSLNHFVSTEIMGSPLAESFDDADIEALCVRARSALSPLRIDEPGYAVPLNAIIASATKA